MPADLDVILLRKAGTQGNYRDFTVRQHRIRAALLWLKHNNPLYSNVPINELTLNALPEDGVPHDLPQHDDTETIEEGNVVIE